MKEKKLGNAAHAQKLISVATMAVGSGEISAAPHLQQQLHDGLQMRSATFQLIKVYFDDEVSAEQVDKFRASLARIRYPNSVMEFFCFGWRAAGEPVATPSFEFPAPGLGAEMYLNGGQQIGTLGA